MLHRNLQHYNREYPKYIPFVDEAIVNPEVERLSPYSIFLSLFDPLSSSLLEEEDNQLLSSHNSSITTNSLVRANNSHRLTYLTRLLQQIKGGLNIIYLDFFLLNSDYFFCLWRNSPFSYSIFRWTACCGGLNILGVIKIK